MVSSLITTIAFMLMLARYYLESFCGLQVLKYDLDTVTVGDWAVELDISDEQYQIFIDEFNRREEKYKDVGDLS